MTEAEVKVSIRDNDRGKIVLFDRPVVQMELSAEESARIGSFLLKNINRGLTAEIRILIEDGFFQKEKKFNEIQKKLEEKGLTVKPDSLAVILSKMSRRRELKRLGNIRRYKYVQSI